MSSGLGLSMNEIGELLDGFDMDDLKSINEDVVRRIRMLRDIENLKTAAKFSIGDEVSFISKSRGQIVGKVTKINRKTIGVKCTNIIGRGDWRVAPSLLRKGAPVTPDAVSQYPNLKAHEDMR